jgi:glycosyltransferase involved in cell wall biosynthesis
LVRALTLLEHEVLMVMPSADGSESLGVPIVPIPYPDMFASLSANGRIHGGPESGSVGQRRRVVSSLKHICYNVIVEQVLQETLARFDADLVYERYSPFGCAGGLLARRLGIPHVLEVNAPLAWEGKTYREQELQEAAETLEQIAFEATSVVVTVSRELRDQLQGTNVLDTKIEVVPNGVDVDVFSTKGPVYRDGLEGKFVVGFVGSLKAWHGVEILADAFRKLALDPCFHLLIVGDGPRAAIIEALAEDLPGRVTFLREVRHGEVPSYLRAMDIALAPYPMLDRFYYSPLKVLEYMAVGRAVVASRIGQLGDLIEDGVTGVLVPPGDDSAIVNAVQRLAANKDLRHSLGARAAAQVVSTHTWTRSASRIIEFAREIN